MISVLILTRNEEANIARCLASVAWSDDVVVLDDGSTDRTVELARTRGARVIRHSFGDEREQRTCSLREITFAHPWVYNPDADEVTTPSLRDEMLQVVRGEAREVAWRVRFKTMFMGRWIPHASLYPTWVMRLFRPERIGFERETNLRYVADGPVGRLRSHFLHYSFGKGLDEWRRKHLRYAALEAAESVKDIVSGALDRTGLLARDPVRRRDALKRLSMRLPYRPALRFAYMYFVRGGFLDGRAGLEYCRLLAWYERMIAEGVARLREDPFRLPGEA